MSESKSVSHADGKRVTERSQSNTNWRDSKSALAMSRRIWCLYPWMLAHWICLYLSVLLCIRTLTLVVVDWWFKTEEFLHKMTIFLRNGRVEQKIYSFLANWSDLVYSPPHLLIVEAHSSVHLFLGCTVPRYPLVGFRPLSSSFILSLCLTLPAISLS